MDRGQEISQIQEVFQKTIELVSLHRKYHLNIPFALKGNLGEFIITLELMKRYPGRKVDYRGGAFPGIDVSIDNVRIQVKTQFRHEPIQFKDGDFEFESSPTIKKATLDKDKCDLLILVILLFQPRVLLVG